MSKSRAEQEKIIAKFIIYKSRNETVKYNTLFDLEKVLWGGRRVHLPDLVCRWVPLWCIKKSLDYQTYETVRNMAAISVDNTNTIGWREWVTLPDLDIPAIKAKIDTGARTSALHAFDMKVFTAGGQQRMRFGIRPLQRRKHLVRYCETDILERRMVTDSGGHRELRYVIRTRVSLAGVTWPIEITLTRRDNMKFRMLLGRTALKGRFLVDPNKSYTAGRLLAKSYAKNTEPGGLK